MFSAFASVPLVVALDALVAGATALRVHYSGVHRLGPAELVRMWSWLRAAFARAASFAGG